MRTKNTIIYSLISTFFLIFLISIWKILATLQGLSIKSFNIEILFIFGFLISFAHLGIGNRIKSTYKSIIFSTIFVFCDGFLIQKLPIWYNFGAFLIVCFFTYKISKYSFITLKEEHSTQVILFDFLTLFGILFFSFVILFPFYMMFVTSFKTQIALLVNPLDFSINFTQDLKDLFKSYFVIFKSYKFGKYILTSTIVSVGTVIITLLFAIPAAYAVARLNFFGKTFLSTSILIIYMFPAIVLVIPLYTIFSQLGLRNSIEGLLIVYTATTLPVAIYMIIPLSIPAISSVALYVFMIAWNEFLFSLMFLDNPNSFTLSRAIQYLSGDAETPRQYLMAGSVVVTLPVLFIFVYFEKYLVSGLTAGSVKG